jgi:hypothetical protein
VGIFNLNVHERYRAQALALSALAKARVHDCDAEDHDDHAE